MNHNIKLTVWIAKGAYNRVGGGPFCVALFHFAVVYPRPDDSTFF
jgi:hypothetical protein